MLLRALSPAALALLDHPPDACHWPLGDAWCCRRATDDGPYCRQHRERARWRPVVVQSDDAEVPTSLRDETKSERAETRAA
jgi:hypothetical protein